MPRRTCLLLMLLATAAHAETFVVCAGVEKYDDSRISSLKHAVADAKSVAASFRASGVNRNQVVLLTSDATQAARRPTRIALVTALQKVRQKARRGDKLIFFFAGHGIEEEGNQYLLTVDTRRDLIDATALPMDLVNRALKGLQASDVLFIVDACRNAPDAGRGDDGAQLTEGLIRGVRPRILPVGEEAKPTLLATLLSCDVGQRAYEDPDAGHGVFTTYLLKGLAGEAATTNGPVELRQLAEYVTREVSDWAKRSNKDQTPRLVTEGEGDMVLLTPPPEPLVSVSFQRQPLSAVVELIAEQYGAQVVLGKGVDANATVSGHLENQPLGTALKVLLLAVELGVRREGKIYIIEGPGTVPEPVPPQPPVTSVQDGGVPFNGPKPPSWPDYLPWPIPGVTTPDLRFRVCAQDLMPQVLIPAGEFVMGSLVNEEGRRDDEDDEGPQRQVYVSAFWMDLHEVTVGQYKRFCQATKHSVYDTWREHNTNDQHPVVVVSWDDATAYAQWAGRELPTEAQWEKAARGGTTTAYPWGDQFDGSKANMNKKGVTPVGSYAPNGFGLFDMAGNVFEWCWDWYDEGWYVKMPSRDPVNETQATYCVLRGGSWDCSPRLLRAANRLGFPRDYRFDSLGFRCSAAP